MQLITPKSPSAALSRVRVQLQTADDQSSLRLAQNQQLGEQVRQLTEQLHTARQTEQQLVVDHRRRLDQLQEQLVTEKRLYEGELTAARHQLQCSQANLSASEQQITALSESLRVLQVERVTHEQRIRELEGLLRTRALLYESVSDQMERHRQASGRVTRETDRCRQWLQRLQTQQKSLIERQKQLELHVQYQNKRLQQLKQSGSEAELGGISTTKLTDTELDCISELKQLIAERDHLIESMAQQLDGRIYDASPAANNLETNSEHGGEHETDTRPDSDTITQAESITSTSTSTNITLPSASADSNEIGTKTSSGE